MHEQHVFEYAIVRVVPRVEREEFINVGVIVFCARRRFLETRIHFDQRRLSAFPCATDAAEIAEHLDAFERISHGDPSGGPIAALDAASRFRWLTATRSTVVQSSKVHPGLCNDPAEVLERIFTQSVL